ncbi:Rep [uncultured virus]|uniref:Rep n=1 Tax=uncultured virus TaxID=340016 RepID=A0A2K9LS94_9VIRU|nr:Rep [uncultured virus]
MSRQKWLKNIFLTYPQCPVPPRCLLDFLQDLLKDNLDCCCISQELHQDGNQHLHAFVQLKEKIRLNKEQFSYYFDLNYDDPVYHPNTQAARNVRNVVTYVVKGRFNGAMQDFVEYGMSAQAVIAKKAAKHDTIAKLLLEGKSIQDCFEVEPGYVGFNLQKVQFLYQWLKTQKPSIPLDPWVNLDLTRYALNSPDFQISEWLNNNLFTRRPPRTKHLYLVGPTQLGKSHLIRCLKNFCRIYKVPNKGPYYVGWEDNKYDLININELQGGWMASDMLQFLDGEDLHLKIHGGFSYKSQNLPTIITSQKNFRQCYPNLSTDVIEALDSRVQYVTLQHGDSQIDVFPGIQLKFDT